MARSFRRLVGIGRHPVPDPLHRHFLARNEIALDQHAPDRRVGKAVVQVVVDPQRRAVLEDHARRALDLNRQRLERIPEPADFELLAVERARFDGAAIVIGHDLAVLVAASDLRALVGKGVGAGLVAGRHQVARPPIKRDVEFRVWKARTLDDGLIVPGQKSLRFAEPRDAHRTKIFLEEGAGSLGGCRLHGSRTPAGFPKRAVDRPFIARSLDLEKGLAARLVGGECGQLVVRRPTLDISPFHRLELAVRELERLVTRLGLGEAHKPQRGCRDASEEDAQTHPHPVPSRLLPGFGGDELPIGIAR